MTTLAEFFTNNIIGVYFFYGLSFFSMGLAVFLEAGHTSELDFARALRPLAGFGLVHGSHEWFEMFEVMGHLPPELPLGQIRLVLLVVSFTCLAAFGWNIRECSKWVRKFCCILKRCKQTKQIKQHQERQNHGP